MQNSHCFALKSSSDESKEQKALPCTGWEPFREAAPCAEQCPAVDFPDPDFIIHFRYVAFAQFTSPLAWVVYTL